MQHFTFHGTDSPFTCTCAGLFPLSVALNKYEILLWFTPFSQQFNAKATHVKLVQRVESQGQDFMTAYRTGLIAMKGLRPFSARQKLQVVVLMQYLSSRITSRYSLVE